MEKDMKDEFAEMLHSYIANRIAGEEVLLAQIPVGTNEWDQVDRAIFELNNILSGFEAAVAGRNPLEVMA
ncbi:hypothetical protein CMUST_01095 [Corynebacterium mustelae]|uniref:Uncharacterized protein n=2 Tax=Corynebacterium mustelae TaxID=571915 RepID=A0A0G3GTW2_9CORY|nr:hypothetical protein CMUST_01095 [Corynebacterium mustelae]